MLGMLTVLYNCCCKLEKVSDNELPYNISAGYKAKQFFKMNYFIRVYQFTLVRTTISLMIIIISDSNQVSVVDRVFSWIILVFWNIGMPLFLFLKLRSNYKELMSHNMIIRYGALYLNYKGILKDCYAIINQLKFFFYTAVAIGGNDYSKFQQMIMILLSLFNCTFIAILGIYYKVMKVAVEAFTEALICIYLVFNYVAPKYIPLYVDEKVADIISFVILLLALFIRAGKIFYDMFVRIKSLYQIKLPLREEKNLPSEKNIENEEDNGDVEDEDYDKTNIDENDIEATKIDKSNIEILDKDGKITEVNYTKATNTKQNKNQMIELTEVNKNCKHNDINRSGTEEDKNEGANSKAAKKTRERNKSKKYSEDHKDKIDPN